MPAPCPGCGTPTPGCGDDAGHRPLSGVHPISRIATGCRTSSGLHSAGSTRWTPPSGRDDGELHRGAHRDDSPAHPAPHQCDDARRSRAPVRHTRAPYRCVCRRPLSGCGRTRATPLSGSAAPPCPALLPRRFPLTSPVSPRDQVAVKGACDRGVCLAAAPARCGAAMPMERTVSGSAARCGWCALHDREAHRR